MNKHCRAMSATRLPQLPILFFLLLHFAQAKAQFVTNGNFDASGTDWNDCGNNTEAYLYETTYGGYDASNHVAEVDGNGTNKTSDNMTLCQEMTGFTVGRTYQLSFMASRRTTSGTPGTVSATVTINGSALNQTVSRNNTTFTWIPEIYTFTATQTTHRLSITPNFTSSLGIIIDDISVQSLNLPVELSSFEAKSIGCEVQLDWSVASAQNFSHFEVEKSFDGKNFVHLDVQALKGSLDTDYRFTDRSPGEVNYYRLKQVDLDGSYEYSKTVFASVKDCQGANSNFLVYPNPVRQGQTLFIDQSAQTDLFLFNAYGQAIQQITTANEGQNVTEVDITKLVPGIYSIGNGHSKATRFVVVE